MPVVSTSHFSLRLLASLNECCWLVHCAAVVGTGWPASSYQLELEVDKWHFSGGDQVSGTSSGSETLLLNIGFGFEGLLVVVWERNIS